MRKLLSLLVILLTLGSIATVNAQVTMDTPAPLDQNVRKGVLPNGLTYYIRHNEEPKDRASFYIVQNVGALLENDDQNGLAHFLEHMAFNGTEHFKGKGILNTLQKHGVEFGRNINAYTAFNETAYNLSEVPTGPKGLVDTCLLVLKDWTNYLLLTEEEIDSERGVISEEWRTRRNAGFRVRNQFFPVLLKGSKYAVRDVIGDYDIINNFKYKTLRDFYHDWYRTDLQCIIVVGDVDVDKIEGKVKEMFSSVPAVKNEKPRPFFDIPYHKETYFVKALDKEMSQNSITVYKLDRTSQKNPETIGDIRNSYVKSLMNSMFNARIQELLQKGDSPFIWGAVSASGFVRGYDCFTASVGVKPGKEKEGYQAILNEWERAARFGFQTSEIDRARLNMISGLESQYKKRDKISNDRYCRQLQSNFLTGSSVIGIEAEYQFAQAVLPTIQVEEVNNFLKHWSKDGNRTVVISGSTEVEHMSETEALSMLTAMKDTKLEPYVDKVTNEPLVDVEKIKAGTIVEEKTLSQFDAKEWTLSNGAKVLYRFADIDKDKVVIDGHSWGGTSKVSDVNKLISANFISDFVASYGAGDFDATSLKKMLTGKRVSVRMSVGGLSENISGYAVPKDFETMMQLLYLKFQSPRFDKQAFDAQKSRYAAYVANLDKNPDAIRRDSISVITKDHNPRVMLLSPATIEKVNFDTMKSIYLDRMKDASDFTFVLVGNVKEDEAKKMVCKYIASLNAGDRKEKFVDNKVTFPKKDVNREIAIKLETPKTTEHMRFNQYMKYSVKSDLCMDIVKAVLDFRFTEKVREEAGGTYGVGVGAFIKQYPKSAATLVVQFDCKPDRADELMTIVRAQIDNMCKEGISEEDFSKAVKNMKKNFAQAKDHNSYYERQLTAYIQDGVDMTEDKNNPDAVLAEITKSDVEKFVRKFIKKSEKIHIEFAPAK
ncbi:insulinase family protein [Halosquirtibacter laminarini]|uniref:Insulinase family protein n=1 Tax=Halosquirtibacter laminarini TaxID=3374600 RepID=A0AC61NHW6_9BACT|nr:insulinase family protein [Prolixibacteraceae bacterium]